jgi:5-methylcytosine-specific restriction endonuclease McrA
MRGKRRRHHHGLATPLPDAAPGDGGERGGRPLNKRARILAIVATDRTFVRTRLPDGEAHVGKCLHCGARLTISLAGEPRSHATIEHILPRNHGGTDELPNLALACARCNAQKGVRLDARRADDPDLLRVVEALLTKRLLRWRDPDR